MAEGSEGIRKVLRNDHDAIPEHYEAEIVIHDYPADRRWRVLQQETLQPIVETTGVSSIDTAGNYIAPGIEPKGAEKKLYLLLKGPTEDSIRSAKAQLLRVLEKEDEDVCYLFMLIRLWFNSANCQLFNQSLLNDFMAWSTLTIYNIIGPSYI